MSQDELKTALLQTQFGDEHKTNSAYALIFWVFQFTENATLDQETLYRRSVRRIVDKGLSNFPEDLDLLKEEELLPAEDNAPLEQTLLIRRWQRSANRVLQEQRPLQQERIKLVQATVVSTIHLLEKGGYAKKYSPS